MLLACYFIAQMPRLSLTRSVKYNLPVSGQVVSTPIP